MTFKNQAIGESLLWWFRDEYWLHKSLMNIENSLLNGLSNIYSEKVISVFLSRYSIRRTIKKNLESEKLFTHELVETEFVKSVKNGKIEQLEHYSSVFESSSKSRIKSALSKFATLYNPDQFIMYDSRSRKGMHRLRHVISKISDEKITYEKIDNYSNYVKYAKILSEKYDEQTLKGIVANLEESEIREFLTANINAFKLRIVDKWLWLEGYDKVKPTKFRTIDYIELINNER